MTKKSLKEVLPEFQEFLVSRKLALEKNAPYYGQDLDALVLEFLEDRKKRAKMEDWQLRQAELALKLYLDHFGARTILREVTCGEGSGENRDGPAVMEEMKRLIRLKHYSYSTERTYLDWARRFFSYLETTKGKDDLSAGFTKDDVKNYLSHLALEQRVSASTQNQAFNALLFLFREVLRKEVGDLTGTVRAKRGTRLPVVLTVEEVKAMLSQLSGRNLLIAQLLYGSGLRLMECARLRVKDVDLDGNMLYVRSGKGDNDRTSILPDATKEALRNHLAQVKTLHEKDLAAGYGEVYLPDALDRKYPDAAKQWGWQYVFPANQLSVDPRSGKIRRHHISDKAIQSAIGVALKKASIAKHATVHTLRHSFATHMLMNGVNIREVQELLGHKNVETTMIYTHVLRDMKNAPKSPLDMMLGDNG